MEDSTLLRAAAEGDQESVIQLIKDGVPLDSCDHLGRTSLHLAAAWGRREVVELIANSNFDLNLKDHDGCTPVFLAAEFGRKEVVDFLLEHGAEVNCVGDKKYTLLHIASSQNWVDVVEFILASGKSDINAGSVEGYTPLIMAAFWGFDDVAAVLIREGAEVNRISASSWTALQYAVCGGHTSVVQVLLEKKGLNLNPQDQYGKTPLHDACCYGETEIVMQLLVAGADTTLKNNRNETALSECVRGGRIEELKLFIQHGSFFEECDLVFLNQNSFAKENVLKDANICTQAIVNKFHNQSLPALKGNPNFANKLPSINRFKLNSDHINDVEDFVKCDIRVNNFCNLVNARPMVLRIMCVATLLDYLSGMKQSSSSDFSDSN